MREPAHDHLVARDHLLPVDAEVLPRLVRPARHREAPGDQRARRRRASRSAPAAARGRRRRPPTRSPGTAPTSAPSAPCCSTCMNTRPRVLPRVLQALRRLGLLEEREQLADLAQRRDGLLAHAHAPRAAACRTGCRAPASRGPLRLARTAAPGRPPSARGRRSRSSRAAGRPRRAMRFSSPRAFELGEEVAQVGVFHGGRRWRGRGRRRMVPNGRPRRDLGTMADAPRRAPTARSSARAASSSASCSRASCCRSSIARRRRRSPAS